MNKMLPELLKELLAGKLPGRAAHAQMSTRKSLFMDAPANAIEAAVLVLLYPFYDQWHIAFIRRNEYEGPHSGQISFPGGKKEDNDNSCEQTALREAEEETEIPANEVNVIGRLTSLYIYISNFLVYPVVGYLTFRPEFRPDKNEVLEILEVSLDHLMQSKNFGFFHFKKGDFEVDAPCFNYKNHHIWGATGMILNELIEILHEQRLKLD
jgi:8-oxo-dGTP pyrophosphatase MutT (NUDIX family)